jgi:tRNA(adenine34) deaminase
MRAALELARLAASEGEAPVGCIVARGDEIVGRGRNTRERTQNALGHAELHAISQACETVGFWRLPDCALYVTLEPCPMCAGAIINARIGAVYFGAHDPKAGACGSVVDLFAYPFNHKPPVRGGILAEESSALLTGFFRELRGKSPGKSL